MEFLNHLMTSARAEAAAAQINTRPSMQFFMRILLFGFADHNVSRGIDISPPF
jgi:hypothetical protein